MLHETWLPLINLGDKEINVKSALNRSLEAPLQFDWKVLFSPISTKTANCDLFNLDMSILELGIVQLQLNYFKFLYTDSPKEFLKIKW